MSSNARWALLLAVAPACSSTSGLSSGGLPEPVDGGDASSDGTPSPPTDGGTGGSRCDPEKKFGAPTVVTELSGDDQEWGPRLSADERTIYFARGSQGAATILFARRGDTTSAFGNPTPLPDVNVPGRVQQHPTVTADGRTLIFSAILPIDGGTRSSLLGSKRTTPDTAFPPATSDGFFFVQRQYDLSSPYVKPAGDALYYGRTLDGGASDIYRATYINTEQWFSEEPVLGVNSMLSSETDPVITPDELTIYIASDRAASSGPYGMDIYVSRRSSTATPFAIPTIVDELRSDGAYDAPGWISADGCVLYFTSGRAGTNDIYVATRSK